MKLRVRCENKVSSLVPVEVEGGGGGLMGGIRGDLEEVERELEGDGGECPLVGGEGIEVNDDELVVGGGGDGGRYLT